MNKEKQEYQRQAKQAEDWKEAVSSARRDIAEAKARYRATMDEIIRETTDYQ